MPNTNGISGTNNNKDSKPRTKPVNLVVLTYSVSPDLEKTLVTLNNRGASVHYIIEENGKQNQFTNDATDITFCCGKSEFRGQSSLNEISINMMLINNAESAFKQEQITKLIDFLQDFQQRYPHLDLKKDIAGLGEVALEKDRPFPRHIAPGKFFPWEQLAQQGFGLFLATTPEQKSEICISPTSPEAKIIDLQTKLREYGYAIEASGIYDDATKAWVTRFNERYVPDTTQLKDWVTCFNQRYAADATQPLDPIDPSLWSTASQLSLEHIQQYLYTKTNIATQLSSSSNIFFNPSAPAAANTTDEVRVQTPTLNLK